MNHEVAYINLNEEIIIYIRYSVLVPFTFSVVFNQRGRTLLFFCRICSLFGVVTYFFFDCHRIVTVQ